MNIQNYISTFSDVEAYSASMLDLMGKTLMVCKEAIEYTILTATSKTTDWTI